MKQSLMDDEPNILCTAQHVCVFRITCFDLEPAAAAATAAQRNACALILGRAAAWRDWTSFAGVGRRVTPLPSTANDVDDDNGGGGAETATPTVAASSSSSLSSSALYSSVRSVYVCVFCTCFVLFALAHSTVGTNIHTHTHQVSMRPLRRGLFALFCFRARCSWDPLRHCISTRQRTCTCIRKALARRYRRMHFMCVWFCVYVCVWCVFVFV